MTDDATAERIRRLQERRGNAPSRATTNGATPEPPAPAVDVDAERAARLQRLQARRSGSAAATPVASAPSSPGTFVGAARPTPNRATRRRHAAPRGRVLAAGLSASAFVGGMTTIAAHPKVWTTSASSALPSAAANGTPTPAPSTTLPPVPPTVVVVEEVHHTVYVDQYGHPIAGSPAPVTTKRTSSVPGSTGAAPARRVGGSSTPAPSASTGSSPAPASGTSSGSSAPPPSSAPAPSPTTTAPPPPPPPPPTCSGSKC